MKVKNIDIINVCYIFNQLYYQLQDNMTKKWKLIELTKELFDIKQRIDEELEKVRLENEDKNENNGNPINFNDSRIQELLSCESSVSPILLSELEDFRFPLEIIVNLKPIIQCDNKEV